jgi:hypothetical protein
MSAVSSRPFVARGAQLVVVALAFLAGGLMLPHVVDATINSGERDAFVPLAPSRVLDTRFGPSPKGAGVKLAAGDAAVLDLPILGQAGVPASATAVLLNVTVLNATLPTHLTIFPTGTTRPNTASTNVSPGQIVPNAVTMKIGVPSGKITIFNNSGTVDVIADVNGFYDDHNHDDRYYTKAQSDAVAAAAAGLAITTADHVGTAQIANGAVGNADLADNAVSSAKITDGTVGNADLTTDAVTSGKIDDGTVTSVDLADNAVTSAKIADGSVTIADMDTNTALFAVTLANGTTLTPGQCLIRVATSNQFPAGKVTIVTFSSGTIPDNIAFFGATTKDGTTPGSGIAPFQVCNTSTSVNAVFTGATFNMRVRAIN